MIDEFAGKLCYLATPYTKYKRGIREAYEEACRIAGGLISTGMTVYSPIAHTHGIAIFSTLNPLNVEMWLHIHRPMIRACDILIVAHMLGWEESTGIAQEIMAFSRQHKPIFDLMPDTLTMARRKDFREDALALVKSTAPTHNGMCT